MRHLTLLVAPLLASACVCWWPCSPPQPTLGERGRISFGYSSAVGSTLDTPVAVGAKVELEMEMDGNADIAATFQPIDPSIVEVIPPSTVNGFGAHGYQVHGLAPGSTELEVFVGSVDTDRVRVFVEAPDTLEFANGWGAAPGPTVVVGGAQRYWVRLLRAGHALAGNGATKFTYTGPLAPAGEGDAPVDVIPDSGENFAVGARPGAATITATSGGVTTTLPVTIVDPSAIDEAIVLRFLPTTDKHCIGVELMAFSAATPVFGLQCSAPGPGMSAGERFKCVAPVFAPAFPDQGGWTGNTSAFCANLCADRGDHATCVLFPSTVSADVPLPR